MLHTAFCFNFLAYNDALLGMLSPSCACVNKLHDWDVTTTSLSLSQLVLMKPKFRLQEYGANMPCRVAAQPQTLHACKAAT